MKVFDNINQSVPCYICGKKTKGVGILIPVDETKEGNNEEAKQIHLECLNLRITTEYLRIMPTRIIYQMLEREN